MTQQPDTPHPASPDGSRKAVNERAAKHMLQYAIKMMACGNQKYKLKHESECRDYADSKTNLVKLKARLKDEDNTRKDKQLKDDMRDLPIERR